MLGRNGKQIREAERVKLVRQALSRGGVDLVHRERNWLAQPAQHLRQVPIGAGYLGAPVDQKNNLRGAIEGNASLLQDLARNQLRVILNDSAGVDQLKPAPEIRRFALDAVARDPWLVAHDGAARPGYRIE